MPRKWSPSPSFSKKQCCSTHKTQIIHSIHNKLFFRIERSPRTSPLKPRANFTSLQGVVALKTLAFMAPSSQGRGSKDVYYNYKSLAFLIGPRRPGFNQARLMRDLELSFGRTYTLQCARSRLARKSQTTVSGGKGRFQLKLSNTSDWIKYSSGI